MPWLLVLTPLVPALCGTAALQIATSEETRDPFAPLQTATRGRCRDVAQGGRVMSTESDVEMSAVERLARSRERMSFWLSDDDGSARANGSSSDLDHAPHALRCRSAESSARSSANGGRNIRCTRPRRWRFAASRSAIVPLVRRHPAAVLGSAAVVGAALVWARPWRWLLRPALILGIASQLAARTMARMATASKDVA